MSGARRALAALALLLAGMTGAASAEPGAVVLPAGPDLAAAGWTPVPFSGRAPVVFAPAGDDAIALAADGAASMLARRVEVDPSATPCLSWRWIVDAGGVPPTDLGRRGGDDRNLIVAIGFAHEPARRGLGERLRHEAARLRAGRDIPGRVIFYVWGGAHPAGTWLESPWFEGVAMIRVVEPSPGPVGAWREARADVAADYRARFGEEPPRVVEVAIGADSDDTASRAAGRIAGLAFRRAC